MITRKDIPVGFELARENGATIIARPDAMEAVRDFLLHPQSAQAAGEYSGRGRLYRIERGDKPPLLVKQYLHGGMFRGVLKDKFLSAMRFLSELYLTGVAAKQAVPTLRIAGLVVMRAGLVFRRAYLFTEELRGVVDLGEYCRAHAGAAAAERRRIVNAVAVEVRNMHNCGIWHADLHLKNILVRKDDATKVYIIDFDKGDFLSNMADERRVENLMRLDRSVEKFNGERRVITLTDRVRFLKGYCGEKGDIYERFKELVRGQVKWRRLHRAWWRIIGRG